LEKIEEEESTLENRHKIVEHIKTALKYISELDSENNELKSLKEKLEERINELEKRNNDGIKKASEIPNILNKKDSPDKEYHESKK